MLAFSANFLSDILLSIKLLPRLGYSLKLSKTNLISYEDEISRDWVCTKLQEKNNIGKIIFIFFFYICIIYLFYFIYF